MTGSHENRGKRRHGRLEEAAGNLLARRHGPAALSWPATRGVALITVLIGVSFALVIVVACTTLATMAARAKSWSQDQTRALYAAESGISRWLFEASIEQTDPGHGSRHARGGNAYGHIHRSGAGSGQGKGGGHGAGGGQNNTGAADTLENLEVSGEVNGVPYVAKVDSSPSEGVYRVVSEAETSSRNVTVAVTVELVPEAWRHVVYARDPHLAWLGFLEVNDPSQPHYTPASGANGGVWLDNASSDFVPVPNWGHDGTDGYWFRVGVPWNPPASVMKLHVPTGGVVSLEGTGPFYIRDERDVKELKAEVHGDLYIEDCSIEKITGHVTGNIVIRNTGKDTGVRAITGRVDGSVCIDSSGASPAGDWPSYTTIGSPNAPATVGGSVYLRGRPQGVLRDALVVLGPGAYSGKEATSVGGGVFADEAFVYLDGKVNIQRRRPYPAILATGPVILSGLRGIIRVAGPVYSEAEHIVSLDGLPSGVADPLEFEKDSIKNGLGVLMMGIWRIEGQPAVSVEGNVVSPGWTILAGPVVVSYDADLATCPPPLFLGGKRVVTQIAGTWSVTR